MMNQEMSREERHKKTLKEYPQYKPGSASRGPILNRARVDDILRMRLKNKMTYAAIGKTFKPILSKQRIEQLVKKYKKDE